MALFNTWRGRDRPLSHVPRGVYGLMGMALVLQLVFHGIQPRPIASADALSPPPDAAVFRVASLGEPVVLAKILMLRLQAFDYQSGISIRFQDLDPVVLKKWLSVILTLDPRGQYPLLAASRFYADIPREDTQRILSEFVYEEFFKDPNRRWPWLGHVAILAKHRLKDLPLSLKYARALSQHATGPDVPSWVKQMEFTVLEDMGELEEARLFIGGLLASGQVTSSHEIHLLNERLQMLEKKASTFQKNSRD